MEFLGLLVYADDRSLGVIRALVYVEHVLHLGDEPGGGYPDAPGLYLPGFEFTFFKRLWMAT